jgi:hypothetical protein
MDKKAAIKATITLFLIFAGFGAVLVLMYLYPALVILLVVTGITFAALWTFWSALYEYYS